MQIPVARGGLAAPAPTESLQGPNYPIDWKRLSSVVSCNVLFAIRAPVNRRRSAQRGGAVRGGRKKAFHREWIDRSVPRLLTQMTGETWRTTPRRRTVSHLKAITRQKFRRSPFAFPAPLFPSFFRLLCRPPRA